MIENLKKSLEALIEKFAEQKEEKFMDINVGEMTIRVEGETMEVGAPIYKVVVDAEGVEQVTPMEDGEIEIEDKIIVVMDGKISEIKDKVEIEVEETSAENGELPSSSDFALVVKGLESLTSVITKLQSEVEVLKSENKVFKSDLDKFAAQPAVQALEVPKKTSNNEVSVYDILKK